MAKKKQENKNDVVSKVIEEYQFAKRYLDPIHANFNSMEELYRAYIDSSTYPHNARVFDPRIFRVIETITPRLVASEPSGSFYPSEEGDIATSQIFNAMIRYDWHRAGMFEKLVRFVKSMLIFGTGFGFTHWNYQESKKKRMVAKEVNGKAVWTPKNAEEIDVVDFDGPDFIPLNIYDCFPDPNATNIQDMRWFILRSFKTLDELKKEDEVRGSSYYKNLDLLEQGIKDSKEKVAKGFKPEDSTFREHRRTMLSTEELHGQDPQNPEFVVLRKFTKDKWIDIVPEYNVCIREIDNPYFHGELPIVYGVDYIYPGELYGMGEIEPIDRVQRAINAVLNQRLDNVQLILRNMWKVRKNSGVDLHTLVSAPGNIVTTEDMNAVEPLTIPDATGGTFVGTMNYLTSALQNGSGITDYTQGIQDGSNTVNDTATGVRLIQQEANAQFKLKIQLLYKMVVERIANQWKDLRIQFTTEAQKLRIVGKSEIEYLKNNTVLATTDLNGERVLPGDYETPTKLTIAKDKSFAFLSLYPDDIQPSIVGDYDFVATVSSENLNDPAAQQQNFFTALERINDPVWVQGLAQQGKQLNYTSLTSKIFDKLGLGNDEHDVLSELKPTPQPTIQPDVNGLMAQMPQGGI